MKIRTIVTAFLSILIAASTLSAQSLSEFLVKNVWAGSPPVAHLDWELLFPGSKLAAQPGELRKPTFEYTTESLLETVKMNDNGREIEVVCWKNDAETWEPCSRVRAKLDPDGYLIELFSYNWKKGVWENESWVSRAISESGSEQGFTYRYWTDEGWESVFSSSAAESLLAIHK